MNRKHFLAFLIVSIALIGGYLMMKDGSQVSASLGVDGKSPLLGASEYDWECSVDDAVQLNEQYAGPFSQEEGFSPFESGTQVLLSCPASAVIHVIYDYGTETISRAEYEQAQRFIAQAASDHDTAQVNDDSGGQEIELRYTIEGTIFERFWVKQVQDQIHVLVVEGGVQEEVDRHFEIAKSAIHGE